MRHAISMDLAQISYLGIMSTHNHTLHLEVWLLPLPIWLEISPSWRSFLEWTLPLSLLSASPIVAATPQPSETASHEDAC